ncbi:MAG: iron export ABC transporter permease subunit FetB [Bacteriovoracaceae bacterium]|nr:iron export ABC transporter permease subunit FetB [Bacteriovoracaceae bacterium]
MSTIEISYYQLLMCLGFVLIVSILSISMKLKLEKEILIGSIRTFGQLLLVGYILSHIFDIENVYLIILVLVWMVFWASHAVKSRVKSKKLIPIFLPTICTMLICYLPLAFIVTYFIIGVRPWYLPQYLIPITGMIIGNSMNAISISLDRFFNELINKKDEIEQALSFGATYQEASQTIFKNAITSGMIPSINSLMTVGLVSLPGMMTGQILGGQAPLSAVKYQIIVMLMILVSTSVGSIMTTYWVRKYCFNKDCQLVF